MEVEAVALTNFDHNDIKAVAGRLCRHSNGALISKVVAEDLERAGLVRIRPAPAAGGPRGKETDDGQGQSSSASVAAPVSPMTTSTVLRRGGRTTRKADE